LPPLLAAGTHVCGFNDKTLKLSVATGTTASMLKQYDCEIKSALAANGYECKSILVRVQPKRSKIIPIKAEKHLSPPPRKCLEKLAFSLSEGRLKEAVTRLLKYSV
jgi:hypothetical protein